MADLKIPNILLGVMPRRGRKAGSKNKPKEPAVEKTAKGSSRASASSETEAGEEGQKSGASNDQFKLTFSPDNLDVQVLALPKFELQCLVKRYYGTLLAIADVECKENDKWCFSDRSIECEHNAARAVLEI